MTAPSTSDSTSPPGSGVFVLSGRVTETPPTVNTGIAGARVTVVTGRNVERAVTTSQMGFYSIPDVTIDSTIQISAEGYVDLSSGLEIGRTMGNFNLMPMPRTTTSTMRDVLSAQVGSCSDGVAMRPCHIMTIPIHNNGPLTATLGWEPSDAADLDLSLFRTGSATPIARSASPGATPERIDVPLTAGATFELRVTYRSGTAPAKYTLTAIHLN